ncbi:phenylacetate--CoA ligase family protein [Sphingobacterium sp. JB170]|uniref:phenylacetate--CoA ligase family protein n=1 Tax=Sphingobacterium sp. JB170 TaxID=1434842 RepID=UPI00097F166B|nr:phenylacetate--CoA ligase family protein [Sphingobacterium sp. JB170]SJN28674.1 Coenzyme F390 synthetase [Sphingobacterium sp. JB170]
MGFLSYFLRNTYWINDFLKGSIIRRQYNDIQFILEKGEQGKDKKKQYLSRLLNHAVNNCKFYRTYSGKRIDDFPVVNKSILIDNFVDISIPSESIPFQKGKIFVQNTSGSTGTPFAVPQDTRKRMRRIAELKYFGNRSGFKSHDRLVHLRTWNRWQNKSKLQSIRENIIAFNIAQIDKERLKALCETIVKKHVVAVRGYASSIDLLAKFSVDNNIKMPSLKLMIAGSEALEESTRDLVQTKLGCNIISQYANEENGILGQEGNPSAEGDQFFYLNHASYYFEVLKLQEDKPAEYGELGRIVITDLFNYAFPLIRYDTGDTAIMLEKNEHSNGFPIFEKLYGRRLDLVFDTKGDIVYPMALARILKHYTQIVQWQFIQNGESEYLLKLNCKEDFRSSKEIIMELEELFGKDANIMVEFSSDIPVLASGKRKPVINNWKR